MGDRPCSEADQPEDRLLTKEQAAEMFQVSTRTVESWMAAQRIPYFKIGRVVRFRWKDVMDHLTKTSYVARKKANRVG